MKNLVNSSRKLKDERQELLDQRPTDLSYLENIPKKFKDSLMKTTKNISEEMENKFQNMSAKINLIESKLNSFIAKVK